MLDLNKELAGVMSAMNQMGLEFDKRLPEDAEKMSNEDLKHMMLCAQFKMIALALLHISSSINTAADRSILESHGFRHH